MSRPLRYVPKGGALVEITINMIQGRYLLRPDDRGRVNELVLGIVGRAQRLYSMRLVGISVLSSHAHILAIPEDAEQLSAFMRHVGRNLSDEIGRLHDWPGKMLDGRYHAIQVSNEEEDQIGRLRYLLAAGVKEHLVQRAIEWPGVHSARALTRDHPLRGWWFDRSKEFAARRGGETFGRYDYATEETVVLESLPCWSHQSVRKVRRQVQELLREIEREAARERRATDRPVVGAEVVMEIDPHFRPDSRAKSPAPDFHAHRTRVRRAMRGAYAWVVAEHAQATARLRAGEPVVNFPEGTFPPGLPFVPFSRSRPP